MSIDIYKNINNIKIIKFLIIKTLIYNDLYNLNIKFSCDTSVFMYSKIVKKYQKKLNNRGNIFNYKTPCDK